MHLFCLHTALLVPGGFHIQEWFHSLAVPPPFQLWVENRFATIMTDTVRWNFMVNGMENFELQLLRVNSYELIFWTLFKFTQQWNTVIWLRLARTFKSSLLQIIQTVYVDGLEWLIKYNDYGQKLQVGSHLEMDESILMTLAVLIFVWLDIGMSNAIIWVSLSEPDWKCGRCYVWLCSK